MNDPGAVQTLVQTFLLNAQAATLTTNILLTCGSYAFGKYS